MARMRFPLDGETRFLFEKLIFIDYLKMIWSRHFVDPAFRLMRFPLDGELDFIWKIDFPIFGF